MTNKPERGKLDFYQVTRCRELMELLSIILSKKQPPKQKDHLILKAQTSNGIDTVRPFVKPISYLGNRPGTNTSY